MLTEEKLIDLRNLVFDARILQEELEIAECVEIDVTIDALELINEEIYSLIESIEI